MSFWNKLKSIFSSKPTLPLFGEDGRPTPALREAVEAAAAKKIDEGEAFSRHGLAEEVLATHGLDPTFQLVTLAGNALLAMGADDWFTPRGYESVGGQQFIPIGSTPPSDDGPAPPMPAQGPVASMDPPQAAVPTQDPFEAGHVLGLSEKELHQRMMKISLWQANWGGWWDAIPPATDERTALIDQALVLRGLLTEAELAEIHRVGDLWLRHNRKDVYVAAKAAGQADAEIAEIAQRNAELRAQKKQEAAQRKAKRRADIAHRRATDIIYLGPGVSGRLGDRRTNVEELEERGLPILSTPKDIADALELTIPTLRWLCFHAEAVTCSHYTYFEVPKRSGGKRLLAAPHRKLAAAQRWIFENVLAKLEVEEAAHGFVGGRSVVSNARPHVGRDVIVNFDLQNFFPTITFGRVRGVFARLGYSPAAASILALLCTECPRRKIAYSGTPYWVAAGDRGLPQGACTSPGISNQIARKLDRRLTGMTAKHGWSYTRYADDLTISAGDGHRAQIPMMMARVRHIVTEEGFLLNEKKGRVQRCGRRQTVTGVIVNEKPGLDRRELRRLRALLHQARKTGLDAQNREGTENFEDYVRGKIAYVSMVDPIKGAKLRAAFGQVSVKQ